MATPTKFYTELEVQLAYEEHMEFFYAETPGTSYVNRETDPNGNIISFYIGREDGQGRSLTGYDQHFEAK